MGSGIIKQGRLTLFLIFLVFPLGVSGLCRLGPSSAMAETIRAAVAAEPETLDPHRARSRQADTFIFPCYQRLTALKEGSTEARPDLALTWRVSNDGRLYTFILKEGVTFSDGLPVNAEAVRRSFERAYRFRDRWMDYFSNLSAIQVLGTFTARFVLRQPDPGFLQRLATGPASIVSPGVSDRPPNYLDRHSLGSGIYRVDSWEVGREITLATRSDLPAQPKVTRFTAFFTNSPANSIGRLRSGKVDFAVDLGSGEIMSLAKDPRMTVQVEPTFEHDLLAFNCRHPWLGGNKRRRALVYALDKEQIIDRGPGAGARRMFGPVPLGMWGHREDLARYDRNIDRAREILETEGPPSRPLKLIVDSASPWSRQVVKVMTSNLAEVGLVLETVEMTGMELHDAVQKGEFDLALLSHRPRVAAPETVMQTWYGAGNVARFENEHLQELLQKTTSTMNEDRRRSLLYQAQETAVDEMPYFFLYQLPRRVGLKKRLQGLTLHPMHPEVFPLSDMNKITRAESGNTQQ